jgi:catechol 2,3-dioxygenase-like lactoylglutathione lyase family enzyme
VPIGKIDNVILNVKDIKKSAEFWSEVLGIKFDRLDEHKAPDGTGITFAWSPLYGLELAESVPPREEGVRGFAIRVKDINEAKAEMAKWSIPIANEIKSVRANEHEVVYDMDGYRLIFTQHDDY